MTITPTDATMAVLAGAPDPTGTSAPSGAADFLAAILQALAPMTGDATGQPAGDTGAEVAGSADGDQAADAAALGLVAAGQVPAALALPASAAAVAAAAPGATGGTPAAPQGAAAGATPGPARPGAGPTPDPTAGAQPTGGLPAADASATGIGQTAPSAPSAGDGHAERDASDPSAGGAGTTPAASTPAADATPATAVTAAGPSPVSAQADAPTPTVHVTRQVFPEVTSLASRGDGTHRITLSLKPEALGEVRVVMTVREGVVHVRLAAGHDAQRALLEGSPELTRLLETAGASETRIVVRDLGTANTNTGTGAGSGQDLSHGLGEQRPQGQGPQDQHAGTRAQHPATDGTNDTRTIRGTTGATPPRSVEPVTGTRTAGVDVTM